MRTKNINFFTTDNIENPFPRQKGVVADWIETCIKSKGYNTASLTIIFCSDEYLLEMNTKHLSHDYYTDVITFDNNESNDKTIDGEIYISLDRVKENAKTFSEPLKKEILRIVAHGLLHLMGSSDDTKEKKEKMTEEENCLLETASLLY